jgi:hypothetical protein
MREMEQSKCKYKQKKLNRAIPMKSSFDTSLRRILHSYI